MPRISFGKWRTLITKRGVAHDENAKKLEQRFDPIPDALLDTKDAARIAKFQTEFESDHYGRRQSEQPRAGALERSIHG